MRVVALLVTAAVLLGSAPVAVAQTGPTPTASGTNTNTLTGGSSSNTNANSNSQFLSGSNTGVNNGSLEIYAGAEPYQGIVFGNSTNLPQLPGIPGPPSNFSQPYRPDAFVNRPPFLPTEVTLEDARRCRDAKASWYGGSREGEVSSIRLFYACKPETPTVALTMANYVGTAMATTADGPFLAALCEAAYRAIRKGATVGLVEFNIRPKNTMMGLGFGASGGATGLPAAGAHPYAIAGTLGFGTGWSNQRVEGEVVLQLTALRGAAVAAAPVEPVAPSPAEITAPPADPVTSPPAADAVTPPPADTPPPGPGAALDGQDPSAAPRALLAASPPAAIPAAWPSPADRRRGPLSAPPGAEEETVVATASPPPSTPGPARELACHSIRRLARLQAGQAKDQVFALFGSTFVARGGKIVEIQGMRLRATARPAGRARLEIGEVSLADERGRQTLYWFLFADGRLQAWGRPEQWDAAAARHGVDLPYRPSPLRVEAKADLASGQ